MSDPTEIDKKLSEILLWWQGKSTPEEHAEKYMQARKQIGALLKEVRLDENSWSRGQVIAMTAQQAPNSGFGRMCKDFIRILNERKLKLLGQSPTTQEEK